jgi:transcriptional regulator with XRE-family HTH domain
MAAYNKDKMRERNAEIGRLLAEARTSRNILMTDCASVIGSTRQRYSAIERGESYVTAVELEELTRFLHLPLEEVLPPQGDERKIRRLPVTVSGDETLYLIVDVASG